MSSLVWETFQQTSLALPNTTQHSLLQTQRCCQLANQIRPVDLKWPLQDCVLPKDAAERLLRVRKRQSLVM
jgi:hypothetical protein